MRRSALLFFAAVITPVVSPADDSTMRWSKSPQWARAEPSQEDRISPSASDEPRTERPRKSRQPSSSMRSESRISPFIPGSNNLSLDVGQVFLMGDLGNRYADSIGTRLHYTYGVSDMFSFDSSFGYSSHSDGNFSMTSLLAGLRSNLAWYDKVIPHAVFGMGFYRPSHRAQNYNPLLFGVHLGAGVNLELTSSIFFGASLTFHNTFGNGQSSSGAGIPAGGSFSSFFLNAGVSF